MGGAEQVSNRSPFADGMFSGLRHRLARNSLMQGTRDIGVTIEFLRTANVADRYKPKERECWKKLADTFLVVYKLQNDAVREKIQRRLHSLSSYQHFVLAEVLWEYSQDTDRAWWLADLITKLWQHDREDQASARDFRFFLTHSEIIPKHIKDSVLSQT